MNQFKSLQRIHTAMLAGMVLFCIVSAIIKLQAKWSADPSWNRILQVVVLALTFVFIRIGLLMFDKRLKGIAEKTSAMDRLSAYRSAAIIKWVLIEGPVLLSVVSFMITRNYAFIALAFALMVFFALQGPLKMKIIIQLQLTERDVQLLEGRSE